MGYDTSNNKNNPHECIVIIREEEGKSEGEGGLFSMEHQLTGLENLYFVTLRLGHQ